MTRTTLLDDLGATLDPATDGPSPEVRHQFYTAIAARPRLRPRLRTVALGWRLAGLATATAALVVAGLVVQTSTVGGHRPSTASAVEVLLAAADFAQRAPQLTARPDQFVFVETVGQIGLKDKAGRYEEQTWLSVDGSRPGTGRF